MNKTAAPGVRRAHPTAGTPRRAPLLYAAWLACVYWLASCSFWLPDAAPLLDAPSGQTSTRVAAILVADPVQPFLTPWVVLSPDMAPQYAPAHIPVDITPEQRAVLPLRKEAGTSYVALVATLVRDNSGRQTLTDIDTTIREQTVAHHDNQRLVRVIGILQPRDGTLVLVDGSQKTIFLPFAPPLQPDSTLMRAIQAAQPRDGAELLVEGVVSGDVLIPLVFAPVFDVRP